jgi:hypothetical protein
MELNGYRKFEYSGVAEFAGASAISFNINYVDPLREMEGEDVQAYSLDTIPPSIGKLKSLRVLNIRGETKLPQLAPSVVFPQLTEVRILNSGFEEMPPLIRNMPNLKALTVRLTPIESVPVWIGELSQLEYLSFESVPISTVPKEIWNCTNLRDLAFKMVALSELPEGVEKLQYLISFEATESGLTQLPYGLFTIPTLSRLNVSSNNLTTLPPLPRSPLMFTSFNISDNQLCFIDEKTQEWIDGIDEEWRFFQNCADEFRGIPPEKSWITLNHLSPAPVMNTVTPQSVGLSKSSFSTFTKMFSLSSTVAIQLIKDRYIAVRELPSLSLKSVYQLPVKATGATAYTYSTAAIALEDGTVMEFNPTTGATKMLVSMMPGYSISGLYKSNGEEYLVNDFGVISLSDSIYYRHDAVQGTEHKHEFYRGQKPDWHYITRDGVIFVLYRFSKWDAELFAFDTKKREFLSLYNDMDVKVQYLSGVAESVDGTPYFTTDLGGSSLDGGIVKFNGEKLERVQIFNNEILSALDDTRLTYKDGKLIEQRNATDYGSADDYLGVITLNPATGNFQIISSRGNLEVKVDGGKYKPVTKMATPVPNGFAPYTANFISEEQVLFKNSSSEGFGIIDGFEVVLK